MKKLMFVVTLLIVMVALPVFAWDGYDYESGNYIEIDKGNLVRAGRDIEFYDYGTGDYHSGEVLDINRTSSGVEVEVYDYETGETRIFEMEV